MSGPFVGKQVGTLFKPTNIPGCAIWLDGLDPNGTGVVPANGASISTWTDKSGNGRNATQATTSKQPIYVLSQGLQFVPANATVLQGSAFTNTTTGANVFVVGTFFSSERQRFAFIVTSNQYGVLMDNTVHGPNISPTSYQTNISLSTNTRYILSGNRLNTGDILSAINGTNNSTFSTSTSTTNRYEIGNDTGNAVPLNGYVHEILYYDAIFTTEQKQQIEGYLAWKWGLQGNLPANHPFKLFPPAP